VRGLKKHLETIPGKHSVDSLQKTAVLATWHIVQKVLQSGTWSLRGGDLRWFKRASAREKRPVTRDAWWWWWWWRRRIYAGFYFSFFFFFFLLIGMNSVASFLFCTFSVFDFLTFSTCGVFLFGH
jgi:hypothetical protein